MRLTEKQQLVLDAVAAYKRAPTARRVADVLDRPAWRARVWHRSQVAGVLRRLERRGLVRSETRYTPALGGGVGHHAVVWLSTPAGRDLATPR